MISDAVIQAALRHVAASYNKEMAVKVERLFRNETKHFTSGNFIATLSAGMEAVGDHPEVLPYGWNSLKSFWDQHPEHKPSGTMVQIENSSKFLESRGKRRFIKFPNLISSMMTVAHVIDSRGGNTGAWFSHDRAAQKKYEAYLLQIVPRFCNLIF